MTRKWPSDQPITLDYFRERSEVDANGCWIWSGARSPTGYGNMRSKGRTRLSHRVAFMCASGAQIDPSVDVCHSCDVPLCVNPDHLFAGSRKTNMQDCLSKGRLKVPGLKGEACGAAILNESQVLAIRADPRGSRKLAAAYGMHRSTIEKIRNRKLWAHL